MPHAPIPATAQRTADGRVVLYAIATGARYTRQDDQAADLLASGAFTTDDPKGTPAITASVPVDPPAPVPPRKRRGR